jgi:hypothetical protein
VDKAVADLDKRACRDIYIVDTLRLYGGAGNISHRSVKTQNFKLKGVNLIKKLCVESVILP